MRAMIAAWAGAAIRSSSKMKKFFSCRVMPSLIGVRSWSFSGASMPCLEECLAGENTKYSIQRLEERIAALKMKIRLSGDVQNNFWGLPGLRSNLNTTMPPIQGGIFHNSIITTYVRLLQPGAWGIFPTGRGGYPWLAIG